MSSRLKQTWSKNAAQGTRLPEKWACHLYWCVKEIVKSWCPKLEHHSQKKGGEKLYIYI